MCIQNRTVVFDKQCVDVQTQFTVILVILQDYELESKLICLVYYHCHSK